MKHWKTFLDSVERLRLLLWDIETDIDLLWALSVRDQFRHMWE